MSDLTKKAEDAPPRKRSFKLPDIYIILGSFVLLMALLTYVIPAGSYDRQLVETTKGSKLIQ